MAPSSQQPTLSETITTDVDASSENNNVTITGKIYTRVRLATKPDLSHIYKLFYQIHEYHNFTHLYKATESSLGNLLFKENPLPLFYGPSVLLLEVSPTPFDEPKNNTDEGFKPVLTTFDLKFPAVEGQVEEFRSKYDDKSDAYIAGYAFFYANYSCFYDKPGFYFESLYFRESYRKLGMGKLFYQIHEYHNFTHLYKATESSLANLLFKENPLPLFYGPSVLLLEVSPTPFDESKNNTDEGFKPVLTTFDLKFPVVEGQAEEFRSKYDDKSDAYIAGYAFFYANYSCFYDKPGFYFESLYFRESYRKLGMGKLLFGTVASIAANNGFVSVEGIVAVWNKKSYDFYINMGVEIFDEFRYGKLHGENLLKYADKDNKNDKVSC